MAAPIAFGALVLLATISMVTDRRALMEHAGRDLPWWQGLLLELAIPIQKALVAPVDALAGTWHGYVDLVGVREENEELRALVSRLEEENLQYREALVASGHLDRIAAMRDHFETPMLPSEVVGLDVSPLFRSVLVDRGVEHGVHAGNPVITDEGVVGLVTRTSPHAAKTMLVLDRQSTVDAVVQRSRARGMVRGRGSDELEFESVARDSDVIIGDVVITSGLGGVYPKGLRLGEIIELRDPGGSLMQIALVKPAVDFGRLEQVFVMLRRGPTMDLLYGGNAPEAHERVDSAPVQPSGEADGAKTAEASTPAVDAGTPPS
ncbi:MAG: rod shape-determining protein MreC [Deltaproteobacteria bacterium]|nr:rod shape-determining protein MreC [Deltaproteobacteria bacterium]